MFHEYTPCKPSTYRLSRIGLDQSAAVRNERGCAKLRSNSDTDGAELENTVPALPSAHALGIVLRSRSKMLQFGTGAAGPTHAIVCVELGRPVWLTCSEMSVAAPTFWKMPATPWMTASGARAAPGM